MTGDQSEGHFGSWRATRAGSTRFSTPYIEGLLIQGLVTSLAIDKRTGSRNFTEAEITPGVSVSSSFFLHDTVAAY